MEDPTTPLSNHIFPHASSRPLPRNCLFSKPTSKKDSVPHPVGRELPPDLGNILPILFNPGLKISVNFFPFGAGMAVNRTLGTADEERGFRKDQPDPPGRPSARITSCHSMIKWQPAPRFPRSPAPRRRARGHARGKPSPAPECDHSPGRDPWCQGLANQALLCVIE